MLPLTPSRDFYAHMKVSRRLTGNSISRAHSESPAKPGLDTWMQVGIKDSHVKEGLDKPWIWVGKDK